VEPFSVVLTETMARKYFPDGNALGKSIRFEKYYDAKITGVISDLPANCDFPFSILISYSSLEVIRKGRLENWFSVNDTHQAYIKLAPGVAQEEMEEKIAAVHAGHTPKDLHESRHYLLQKLSDMHYDSRFGTYSGRTISKDTVTALAIIGLFLLVTAGINYINLSTAQSFLRSKEIGVRKVLGSNRKNLIGQFMTETFILVLISGIFALVVAEILLLKLQSLVNLKLDGFNFTDPFFLLSLLLIVLVVTLFSGSYPSLITSGFNPVSALKNKFSGETVGNISLRKILVVSQFTITQILVVGTFIVVSQMRYFRDVNMGFNREAIITLDLPNTSPREAISEISNQLISQSFVSGFSFSSTLPSGIKRNRSFMDIGKNDASEMKDFVVYEYQAIDSSYLGVYQIKLLAGRTLGLRDSNANVLINKTLLNTLQLGSPEEALNKELKMGGGSTVTVVGVIDDFYSNSLKEPVDNMLLVINPRAYDFCSIKINTKGGGSLQEGLKNVERIWTKTYPDHLFNYQFFDENVQAFYAQEEKYAKLFQVFSVIFLIIGCLGLYGLITFVVNRKGKEVAIRKVLGASLSNILLMFSTEYIRLILLSFVLAVPVTYYVVNEWLSNFANHIELEWWFFATPGLLVLVIALFVVITKSLSTANANPVDRLKYE
jgi:putative ABC transport system permease protein